MGSVMSLGKVVDLHMYMYLCTLNYDQQRLPIFHEQVFTQEQFASMVAEANAACMWVVEEVLDYLVSTYGFVRKQAIAEA